MWSVAISESEQFVVSGSEDKTVRVWSLVSKEQVLVLEGHSELVISVAFSSKDEFVVSGSHDETLRVWDLVSGKETIVLRGHTGSTAWLFLVTISLWYQEVGMKVSEYGIFFLEKIES